MTELRRTDKALLALRIVAAYVRVHLLAARHELPDTARRLAVVRRTTRVAHPPPRLSRGVDRVLRIGPWQPRCLIAALVLYRLLHEQGEPASVVIGLPSSAAGPRAHAWVELSGHDVGPPPGRGVHVELARFGSSGAWSKPSAVPRPSASAR